MTKNLSQILPDSNSEDILRTPLLKIRGKTMVFGNVIYQINNISSIGFVNLTTTTRIRMPRINYVVLFIGVVCLFIPQQQIGIFGIIIGLILIGIAIYLISKHQSEHINEKYGMTIYANSGTQKILTSKSKEIIFEAMLALFDVMNSEEFKTLTFDFSEDKSVIIQGNNLAPVTTGIIGNDIVNRVN